MDGVLEDILKAYSAAKIQKMHILNQNGANLVNNHALDTAQKLGIPTEDANKRLGITPFPSPVSNSSVNYQAGEKQGKMSPWATAALIGASALGGAGASVIASQLLKPDSPVVQEQIQQKPPNAPNMGVVGIDVS